MPNKPLDQKLSNTPPVNGHTLAEGSRKSPDQTPLGNGVPASVVELFPEIVSPNLHSSGLSLLEECPRKFVLSERLGVARRGTKARALTMGDFFHVMVQNLFLGSNQTKCLAAAAEVLAREQRLLVEQTNSAGLLPDGSDVRRATASLEEDYYKACAMALVFFKLVPFHSDKWDVLALPDGSPMIECRITAKIPGIYKPIAPKVDLALVRKGTTGVWVVDHKTTSFSPSLKAKSTPIDPQLKFYVLGLQQFLDELHRQDPSYPAYTVEGVIHNIVKKPTIKYCPDSKDKGGFQSYLDRLTKWYQDLNERDPSDPPMLQSLTHLRAKDVGREFKLRLLQYSRAAHANPSLERFFRAGGYVCFKMNSVCPFLSLCTAPYSQWPSVINEQFTISPQTALDRVEENTTND